MAGVVLSDSFLAAKAVTECRVHDRRWGGISLPARRRGRHVASSLHGSGAAFCVTLDGDSSPAAASSRLVVFPCAGTARSRRPGCRGVLSAWGRTLSAGAGFMPFCGRVDQLLDAPRHVGELISPQPVQLFCGRLSGSQILERCGVDRAVCPQHAGDGRAALLDEAGSARLGPP